MGGQNKVVEADETYVGGKAKNRNASMTRESKKQKHSEDRQKPIPFDDALRRMIAAPPMHKPAKKPAKPRNKKPGR